MANNALPDGWEWTTIGDVADTTSGGTPSRKYSEYFEGTIPWVKSGELGDGLVAVTEEKITEAAIKNSSAKIFPSGSVLVALYGATVGKVGILNMDAASNQAVCALFPKNNSFTAKYMFYWLMSQRQELINKSVGGAQPNVSQGIVRSHPFPLAPVPEQERIVSRIEELLSDSDAGAGALERVYSGLQRYKMSVLKAAVEGKLVKQDENDEPAENILQRILELRRIEWQEKHGVKTNKKNYEELELSDVSNLPKLPNGWVWSTLAKLIHHIETGHSFKAEGRPAKSNEFGVLKVSAMSWEKFLPEENKALYPGTDPGNTPTVKAGDLLISRANTVELVGAVVLVEKDYPNLLLSDKSLRLILVSKEILPKYLLYALRTKYVRDVYEREATGTSDSMRNLSQDKILMPPIPLPPLNEQQRIVAEVERRLSVVAEVESAVETGLVRAERLRQSVLKSAFEGRL